MAVFTEVSEPQAEQLMQQLQLGQLVSLQGICDGIENTNYFATTTHGDFVLTLFERLSHAQLPFYLQLMKHLAAQGIKVPMPQSNAQGDILFTLCDKPAAVVERLRGESELHPTSRHCQAVGDMLARMHLAGANFEMSQPNLRNLSWWNETAPIVMPHLSPAQNHLLASELAFQNHVAASSAHQALPRGPVHADLFRNNVLFEGEHLSGFFDFYFAGVDAWLFDLAVALNDWCIDLDSGVFVPDRFAAMLAAYQGVRPLQAPERQLLNPMLRAAALRFWISRLWDYHLPREASMLQAHDPSHFERVLGQRIHQPMVLNA
ncbi:MAG: homoserine kinase [Betaproteobacteria bacterium]|nr:homoserine kinase [Betaproteobacteria bacterium]NBY04720.1 homoserine kinase [Betaproteobacteria bacterium]